MSQVLQNIKDATSKILTILCVLFIANCFLGTDRLWNLVDYHRMRESTAIEQAREVTVCIPTQIVLKGTKDTVRLPKGEKVKVLARYREFLKPLKRMADYLPDHEYVIMREDGTIGKGLLPEVIVGTPAFVTENGEEKELTITNLIPAQKVTYQRKKETRNSLYPYRFCLSDGRKIAFEDLSWQNMNLPSYCARGKWSSIKGGSLTNVLQSLNNVVVTFSDINYAMPALGSRPKGYYKNSLGGLCSLRMKKWAAKGLAGMLEGALFLLFIGLLPFILHRTIYHLPGKNGWIIFLSWALTIVLIYLWIQFITGLSVNLFIAVIGIFSAVGTRSMIESCRCKVCGGVDCLETEEGTPVKIITWWTRWHSASRKIGEKITTTTTIYQKRYGQETKVSTHTNDIERRGRQREEMYKRTWGEAYHCKKCDSHYEYLREETGTNTTDFHFTESEQDAIQRS